MPRDKRDPYQTIEAIEYIATESLDKPSFGKTERAAAIDSLRQIKRLARYALEHRAR